MKRTCNESLELTRDCISVYLHFSVFDYFMYFNASSVKCEHLDIKFGYQMLTKVAFQ